MNPIIKPLRTGFPASLVAPLIVAVVLVILYWSKLTTYAPGGDDYSMIEASRSLSIRNWFFSGFSDYFYVFDGAEPYTNFVRPVANLVFWVNNQVFPGRLGLYFLSSILFVAIYCHQLLMLSGYGLPALILISAFCMASPSIAQASLGSLPLAFDVLAAAFILAAINASFRNKYFLSLSLLLVSVFTKEIGLSACIAFAIWRLASSKIYGQTTRLSKVYLETAGYIFPVFAFVVVRILGVGIGGTYSTNNLEIRTLFVRVISFPLRFPVGLGSEMSGYRNLLESGQILAFLARLAPLLINLTVFICAALLILSLSNSLLGKSNCASGLLVSYDQSNALLIIVTVVSSIYLCILGVGERFYPLPQGCLLVLFLRSMRSGVVTKSTFRISFTFLLILYSFLFSLSAKSAFAFQPGSVDKVLSEVLKQASLRQMKTVLLVNAPDIYSSPAYIASYYSFDGDLDFLFNSRGSCGLFPDIGLFSLGNDHVFSYRIKFFSNHINVANSNKCKPAITFNGYSIKELPSKAKLSSRIVEVAGNKFYYSNAAEAKENHGAGERIMHVDIAKQYDGVFIANYVTGRVKLLPALASS